jgi:hypothetical protein
LEYLMGKIFQFCWMEEDGKFLDFWWENFVF